MHLIHVILKVFGIWMHSPHFKHFDNLTLFANTFQSDQWTVGRVGVKGGFPDFLYCKIEQGFDVCFIDDIKSTGNKPPERFGTGNHPVLATGKEMIQTRCDFKFWHQAFYRKIQKVIVKIIQEKGIFFKDPLLPQVFCFHTSDEGSVFRNFGIYCFEEPIQVSDIVDPFQVDDGPVPVIGLCCNIK